MRRRIAFALTAALVAVFLYPPAAGASARGDGWRARSITAFLAARSADDGSETPHFVAAQAATSGRLNGWSHAYTSSYLARLYGLANPDGGYGLGYAYDAFGDGSVNPASTTYAVTLADHVGRPLLEGYRAGVVPRARVQAVVDLLMAMPRVPVARGACVAYSAVPSDVAAGCVHNVSAGVALFLVEAAAAGLGATGMHALITAITLHEVDAARLGAYGEPVWWPYLAGGANQDVDHNSYSAESVYRLAYWLGREAAYQHMVRAADPVAHMRLVSLPGGVASTSGSTTLWCVLGDSWTSEADAWIAGPRSARQWAQAGYLAARAWQVCA